MRAASVVVAAAIAATFTIPATAYAHCDTLDGPVAKAGQRALDAGNLDYALVWIKPAAEPELRASFKQALAVRKLDRNARALADRYFLETLVRLHRAGEGEPYTGLKPKGTDVGPAIPAAEEAVRSGSAATLATLINEATTHGLRERIQRVNATRNYKPSDVAAGRAYVEAYVDFLHYAERLYVDARGAASPAHDHH